MNSLGKARRTLAIFLWAGLILGGCQNANVEHEPENLCREPRPEVCTMEYRPVCGLRGDTEQWATYGNGCEACREPQVIGYEDGACEDQASGT